MKSANGATSFMLLILNILRTFPILSTGKRAGLIFFNFAVIENEGYWRCARRPGPLPGTPCPAASVHPTYISPCGQ
jgi:hypothetical protein